MPSTLQWCMTKNVGNLQGKYDAQFILPHNSNVILFDLIYLQNNVCSRFGAIVWGQVVLFSEKIGLVSMIMNHEWSPFFKQFWYFRKVHSPGYTCWEKNNRRYSGDHTFWRPKTHCSFSQAFYRYPFSSLLFLGSELGFYFHYYRWTQPSYAMKI